MNVVWIAFAGGALAFAHCLGMCGGFALHLAQADRQGKAFANQVCWHAGRIFTYVFLGALAGFAGSLLTSSTQIAWIQRALAYAAGSVMILSGLMLLGRLPSFGGSASSGLATLCASAFRNIFQHPTPAGALTLGLATGFLPCPVVLGFLALAAQNGSVPAGMSAMAALGLGTVWSLLLLSLTGRLITGWFRRWGAVAGGVVLLLLGVATVLRGTDAWHRFFGCPGKEVPTACCGHEK